MSNQCQYPGCDREAALRRGSVYLHTLYCAQAGPDGVVHTSQTAYQARMRGEGAVPPVGTPHTAPPRDTLTGLLRAIERRLDRIEGHLARLHPTVVTTTGAEPPQIASSDPVVNPPEVIRMSNQDTPPLDPPVGTVVEYIEDGYRVRHLGGQVWAPDDE